LFLACPERFSIGEFFQGNASQSITMRSGGKMPSDSGLVSVENLVCHEELAQLFFGPWV
jgi:hypothetical protein